MTQLKCIVETILSCEEMKEDVIKDVCDRAHNPVPNPTLPHELLVSEYAVVLQCKKT